MPASPAAIERMPAAALLHDFPPIEEGRYVVRFARSVEEIEAAMKLRFEVFNLELGEGLDSSFETGRDRDEFDATCHHLIVLDREMEVVGTYRLRTLEMAQTAEGFYSAREFDLSGLPPEVLGESIELGRACIARAHRNRQVLYLLWKGLAQFAVTERKRFLFGCCSLTSQNPSEGVAMLEHLKQNGHLHSQPLLTPRPGYECTADGSPTSDTPTVQVPRLFATYLGIGAKVCSRPALDRCFKTIDFLVIFDIEKMEEKTRGLYFAS